MSQQLLVLTSNHQWFACSNVQQAYKLAEKLLKQCEYVKIVQPKECETTLTKSGMTVT